MMRKMRKFKVVQYKNYMGTTYWAILQRCRFCGKRKVIERFDAVWEFNSKEEAEEFQGEKYRKYYKDREEKI